MRRGLGIRLSAASVDCVSGVGDGVFCFGGLGFGVKLGRGFCN
jgi:hypothetical protein